MTTPILIAVLVALVVLGLVFRYALRRAVIFEYERGLRYRQGQFKNVLGPGQHWYFPYYTTVLKVDVRPVFTTIGAQEVLTARLVTRLVGAQVAGLGVLQNPMAPAGPHGKVEHVAVLNLAHVLPEWFPKHEDPPSHPVRRVGALEPGPGFSVRHSEAALCACSPRRP